MLLDLMLSHFDSSMEITNQVCPKVQVMFCWIYLRNLTVLFRISNDNTLSCEEVFVVHLDADLHFDSFKASSEEGKEGSRFRDDSYVFFFSEEWNIPAMPSRYWCVCCMHYSCYDWSFFILCCSIHRVFVLHENMWACVSSFFTIVWFVKWASFLHVNFETCRWKPQNLINAKASNCLNLHFSSFKPLFQPPSDASFLQWHFYLRRARRRCSKFS